MKLFYVLLIASALTVSCQGQDRDVTISTSQQGSKIEILDFHSTHRCKTCLKIEDNTRKLLDRDYKQELDDGVITFQTINIDEDQNAAIAKRFQAGGTALFINVVKDGQESHIDLTDFAFLNAFNVEKFQSEIKTRIEEHLKTL